MLLTDSKKEYLVKVKHFSLLIQQWVIDKADFRNITSDFGIFPELIMAEVMIQSDWGDHPLSQDTYTGRYSNNLLILKADKSWCGKKNKYKDEEYKAYKTWSSFAVDASDHFVFSGMYDDVILSRNLTQQISIFSLGKPDPLCYNEEVNKLIFSIREILNGYKR